MKSVYGKYNFGRPEKTDISKFLGDNQPIGSLLTLDLSKLTSSSPASSQSGSNDIVPTSVPQSAAPQEVDLTPANNTPAAAPSLWQQYINGNLAKAKPTYAGSYEGQMAELYDKINGRDPFSYDASKDPLYQAYKDQYIQGGKLAMKDTMGQAAALTGGYGSTYGQAVGQQAYDAYLQNLTEVIPTLYQTAYGQYKDQGDQMMQQYAMLGDLRDQEYGRYRDALGDWEGERAYATQLEAEDYKRRTAAENTAYNRQQDAYANLYAAIKTSGYVPSDAELQAAGMTRAAAEAIAAEYQRGVSMDERTMALKEWSAYNSGSGGGGSSGGGGGGGGGGYYSGYSGDPYAGDIWDESWAQYQNYGYQNTSNDLKDMYDSGAITMPEYVTGQSAANMAFWQDKATQNAKNALAKYNNPSTDKNLSTDKGKSKLKQLTDKGKSKLK